MLGLDNSQWDDSQDKYVDNDSGLSEPEETTDRTKAATTFYRVMEQDNNKKLKHEKIKIESLEVRKLYLECCLTKDPNQHEQEEILELESPFKEFVWYYDAFFKASQPQDSDSSLRKEGREDLKQLLHLVRKSSMEPYFKVRDTIESTGMIKYEHLWSIFPPGERVYCKPLAPKFPDWQMFEVDEFTYHGAVPNDTNPPKYTNAWLHGFDCDGTKFESYEYAFKIVKFKEEKAIDTLEVFPTRFYRNAEKRRDDRDLQTALVERGRKWADLCASDARDSQRSYDGPGITSASSSSVAMALGRNGNDNDTATSLDDDDNDDNFNFKTITPDIQGKIIVDNYLFLRSDRAQTRYSCPPLGHRRAWDIDDSDCQW